MFVMLDVSQELEGDDARVNRTSLRRRGGFFLTLKKKNPEKKKEFVLFYERMRGSVVVAITRG